MLPIKAAILNLMARSLSSAHFFPSSFYLQPKYPEYEEEYEDEEDEWITKWDFRSRCRLCRKEINLYHRYYYNCSHGCDNYSLHKFCGDLPATLEHSIDDIFPCEFLVCKSGFYTWNWMCAICRSLHEAEEVSYSSWVSGHIIGLKCVTRQGKNLNYHDMIYHPSHPHPLSTVNFKPILSECDACGKRHMVCYLSCNGFAYGCIECDYYIDISCGFIPEKIVHEAHPHHLLLRAKTRADTYCGACLSQIFRRIYPISFRCITCEFNLHPTCALSFPRMMRHKLDKHPMNLRYLPVENHKSKYFCEF
ncbi:uncharacterized protein LOC112505502 [Cynara cardunculus var. scolymus]|uniref:uncharacterized protein LOC112505502 n=1 Tax=Cynara cardunculus var. scolymus TaxID=59895 RepID=UPI000D62D8F9|nr:uncharacterized protein LOC112505502 [Cynara cardunculus var. scolymus]